MVVTAPGGICRLTRRHLSIVFERFSAVYISFSKKGSDKILLGLYVSCVHQGQLGHGLYMFRVSCRVRCDVAVSCISQMLRTGGSVLRICHIYIPFHMAAYASVCRDC